MLLIPVIDLRQGLVVHARGGARAHYAPVTSALSASAEPLALLNALMSLRDWGTLYVADLDALGGTGDHGALLERLLQSRPGLELWLDAGPRTLGLCRRLPRCRPVLGTECYASVRALEDDIDSWRRTRGPLLSLDYRAGRLLGPPGLETASAGWPHERIIMELDRVGSEQGPALERLQQLRRCAPKARLYAAGGVRGTADLEALREAGCVGVLLASALHRSRPAAEALAHWPAPS